MDSDSDSDDDKPSDYTWVLPILLLGVAAQRQEQPQGLARLYILAMPGICKLIEVVVRVASDVGSLLAGFRTRVDLGGILFGYR